MLADECILREDLSGRQQQSERLHLALLLGNTQHLQGDRYLEACWQRRLLEDEQPKLRLWLPRFTA
ncbi:MAG TPA: hypothetical protein VGN82_26055 [Bosea sp. (in: a-proteobacteria)]|jgi:hypothetical protein|uniref:hypothetical protein n=1 Tax=Bosea sp. (in: a-proteobacteria) TaxID=1871050 RepID=UPI002E12F34B|nr:hypothetical protein [Bosea sp. (in: a-proteobacteria)]